MYLQDISFDENDITKNVFLAYRIRATDFNPAETTIDFNPAEITSFLGIQPSRFYSKGEKYLGKKMDQKTRSLIEVWRTRKWSLWDLDTKTISDTTKKVDDHIIFLLDILESRAAQIRIILDQVEKYTISFYLRWIPVSDYGSYSISSNLLERMAKLSHFVEFYFMTMEDSDEL